MEKFELMEIGVPYNPQEHRLIPTSLYISSMRAALGTKDLHMYFHLETEKYVIFTWWRKPGPDGCTGGIMCEVDLMDTHPDHANAKPIGVADLREKLLPTIEIYKRMKKHNDEQLAKIRAQKEQEKAERDHFVRGLRKEGKHETAHLLDIGAIPFMPPDEQTGEMFKQLKEDAKGKLIVPLS